MTTASRFWIWFPTRNLWLPGTPAGAAIRFIDFGQEVAWGRRPPARPGLHPETFPPLLRSDAFARLMVAVDRARHARHRVAIV